MEPFFRSPQCHGCFLLGMFCLSQPISRGWALSHSSGSPSLGHLPDVSRWSPEVKGAKLGALPTPSATHCWAPSSHLSCKHSSHLSQKEKKKNKKSGDHQILQFLIKGVCYNLALKQHAVLCRHNLDFVLRSSLPSQR